MKSLGNLNKIILNKNSLLLKLDSLKSDFHVGFEKALLVFRKNQCFAGIF